MRKSIFLSALLASFLLAGETTVIQDTASQQFPDINDKYVVWSDTRDGGYDIYLYDLENKTQTQVTKSDDYEWSPKIYGDKIVYSKASDIYLYDISSGQETAVTTNPFGQSDPGIYGSTIVWADRRDGFTHIYMKTVGSSEEIRVTDHDSNQEEPKIYGDKIIYIDDRNKNEGAYYTLYLYNLSTHTEERIPSLTANVSQTNPFIYKDKIVWNEKIDGYDDVVLYDLSTSKYTRITTDPKNDVNPTIYDNKIVYSENGEIFLYDLSSSKKVKVVSKDEENSANAVEPHIYKNSLLYLSIGAEGTSLKLSDLSSLPANYDKSDFVKRLYTTLLGRAYDDGGLNFHVGELENGNSALDVAKSFFFSPEFQNMSLSDEEFLSRLYHTFLDREPDSGGVKYWKDQMQNGGKSRRLVFYEFAFSPEFQQLAQKYKITPYTSDDKLTGFMERLFVLVMGRESDQGGMDYWKNALKSHQKSADEVVKNFYSAPEFLNKNLSNRDFIINAYRAIMGRDPDEGGLGYWENKMKEGLSKEDILDQFLSSNEFKNLLQEYGL